MSVVYAERLNETRPNIKSTKIRRAPGDIAFSVFQSATHALRWNIPEVATDILVKNEMRIADLERQARTGSPSERAETRHILAKARGDVTRLRRLGLSSGSSEENSSGMIFIIGAERAQNQPIHIRAALAPDRGDKDAQFQLWYLSFAQIERVVALSHRTNVANQIDPYVFRAAIGLVYAQDNPKNPSNEIYHVDLDPIAASGLIRVADYMRSQGIHGRIPSRREILIKEILHSGQFPVSNMPESPKSDHVGREEKAA